MEINANDRQHLKKALSTNSAILFVGAGFSASATNKLKQRLPSGSEFAQTLWSFLHYKGDYDGTPLQVLFDAALKRAKPVELKKLLEDTFVCSQVPQWYSVVSQIWLLDDDVSMLKALGRLMNSAGFIVEKFNDPATFLANLQHVPCRVAILDVWMPQMNGLEVQARLNRDSPETRIIFLTGRDDPVVRQTALDAGAVAFLAKPFDDENLVRFVREAEKAAAT